MERAPGAPLDDLRACEVLARAHYENFAIGSFLLPRPKRRWLAAIYAVVRVADDLADDEVQRLLELGAARGAPRPQRGCGIYRRRDRRPTGGPGGSPAQELRRLSPSRYRLMRSQ